MYILMLQHPQTIWFEMMQQTRHHCILSLLEHQNDGISVLRLSMKLQIINAVKPCYFKLDGTVLKDI